MLAFWIEGAVSGTKGPGARRLPIRYGTVPTYVAHACIFYSISRHWHDETVTPTGATFPVE